MTTFTSAKGRHRRRRISLQPEDTRAQEHCIPHVRGRRAVRTSRCRKRPQAVLSIVGRFLRPYRLKCISDAKLATKTSIAQTFGDKWRRFPKINYLCTRKLRYLTGTGMFFRRCTHSSMDRIMDSGSIDWGSTPRGCTTLHQINKERFLLRSPAPCFYYICVAPTKMILRLSPKACVRGLWPRLLRGACRPWPRICCRSLR